MWHLLKCIWSFWKQVVVDVKWKKLLEASLGSPKSMLAILVQWRLQQGEVQHLLLGSSDRVIGPYVVPREVQVGYQEQFILRKSSVAQAAHRGGWVTVPGGVWELWRCGTEACVVGVDWTRWSLSSFPTLTILWFHTWKYTFGDVPRQGMYYCSYLYCLRLPVMIVSFVIKPFLFNQCLLVMAIETPESSWGLLHVK